MNQSDRMMTLRIAADARDALERWADQNLTTLTAEVTRSIRERAQRERWERARSASAPH